MKEDAQQITSCHVHDKTTIMPRCLAYKDCDGTSLGVNGCAIVHKRDNLYIERRSEQVL